MFEIYKILSTIVKYRTIEKTLWEDKCAAQTQLVSSFLTYLDKCGIDLPPQEKENICYYFTDLFYDFEKFLKEAKFVEK